MALNKKIFMLKKLINDLKTPKERYKIADDVKSNELGYYYFVFDEKRVSSGKDQKLLNHFDENGIPVNKTYIDVEGEEFVYFPITIGQMGLAIFHTWLKSGKEEDKERFLKYPHWFETNAEESHQYGARWLTKVSLPQYHNPGSWQSAFSQARAINILLRGYQLTDNEDWADLARLALTPFTLTVEDGGVTSMIKTAPFYEEYPAEVPTMVLNGMIFALFGIHDYIRVFPEDKIAKELFNSGIQSVQDILPVYDLGYWSRYNLCQAEWYPEIDPATILYQRLHIAQLKVLYKITEIPVFQKYAYLFQKQDNIVNALRMYSLKYKSLKKINRL
ncbi:MAG: D-glucuronyl C5-epimerase family protein [Candidatus Stygibacter frigidus]|nr:D-glucuronyl C5-epimerase family protein [Candidatus Stygibacter frigidus]